MAEPRWNRGAMTWWRVEGVARSTVRQSSGKSISVRSIFAHRALGESVRRSWSGRSGAGHVPFGRPVPEGPTVVREGWSDDPPPIRSFTEKVRRSAGEPAVATSLPSSSEAPGDEEEGCHNEGCPQKIRELSAPEVRARAQPPRDRRVARHRQHHGEPFGGDRWPNRFENLRSPRPRLTLLARISHTHEKAPASGGC